MDWTRLVQRLSPRARARPTRSGTSTSPDLRAHLPLLWPHGPGGAVDEVALAALGRGYARAGRTLPDLLADLDILCAVVGIGTSSRMIEASSVAWSDAFLDGVAPPASAPHRPASRGQDDADLDEVERLLDGLVGGGAWGGLVPPGRLLLVTWSALQGLPPAAEEVARVVTETRRIFPGAAVAPQPSHDRVVAAVADSSALPGRAAALSARCAELATGSPPVVSLEPVPSDVAAVGRLLRPTG
ncbi:hypothetical protein [Nocardioides sp. 1609]|uniref:hypothetical protein n=1 Tax=Nocardioides sp. 1609 TaxID=2508327 RepID=UPI00106F10F7|nr:hypothetical protein [Nocardioides sp. 1609]